MGRNNKDFSGDSRLSGDESCEQGDCKQPATKFSWANGTFCSDCWSEQNGKTGGGA